MEAIMLKLADLGRKVRIVGRKCEEERVGNVRGENSRKHEGTKWWGNMRGEKGRKREGRKRREMERKKGQES